MAWIFLLVAGGLEVVWAYFMKQSAGFTRSAPSVITVVAMLASVALLALSMKSLPLGTAYTVWTGIGAVGAFLVGIAVLGEPASAADCRGVFHRRWVGADEAGIWKMIVGILWQLSVRLCLAEPSLRSNRR